MKLFIYIQIVSYYLLLEQEDGVIQKGSKPVFQHFSSHHHSAFNPSLINRKLCNFKLCNHNIFNLKLHTYLHQPSASAHYSIPNTKLQNKTMQNNLFIFLLVFPSACNALSQSSTRRCFFPNSIETTPTDLKIMLRQTGQAAPTESAIGVPSSYNCRHGCPQAFAMDPMPATTGRVNSGLIKLTCPLLVNAIDALEDEGMISALSKKMGEDQDWQRSARDIHVEHAQIRKQMITGDGRAGDGDGDSQQMDVLKERLGEKGTNSFLDSGVAGSTLDSLDVKCIHAWMGDYLFRFNDGNEPLSASSSSPTPLGKAICEGLAEKGVDLRGTVNCSVYCDPNSSLPSAPPNPRNKQRLKSRKEVARRKRNKDGDVEATSD